MELDPPRAWWRDGLAAFVAFWSALIVLDALGRGAVAWSGWAFWGVVVLLCLIGWRIEWENERERRG